MATVNSKGIVTGVKQGTATNTVKSGKKKVTCKVTVPGIKNTDLKNVASSVSIKKGKTTAKKKGTAVITVNIRHYMKNGRRLALRQRAHALWIHGKFFSVGKEGGL